MKDLSAGGAVPSLGRWLRSTDRDEAVGTGFLVMVTLLAALLRIYRLGAPSLWIDEILTVKQATPGLDFWRQMLDTTQGPLYVAAIWSLVRQGASDLLLRLPSVLAGVATIPLLAMLTKQLCGTRAARLVALLLALSPFHLWYSQEARGYAFAMFFAVATTMVLLDLMRRGPRVGPAILFGLLTAGGVWSNLSALFLWAGQGLAVLVLARPRNGRQTGVWALAFVIGLAAVVPWVLKSADIVAIERLAPAAATGIPLRAETTFSLMALPFTAFNFFFGSTLGPALAELRGADRMQVVLAWWPLLLAGGTAASVAAGAGLLRLRQRQWLLPLLWIVPLAAVTVLAVRNVKTFNPRYLAVIFPFVLAVAAYGVSVLPRRLGGVVSVVLIALFLWSDGNHFWNTRYRKADVRAAAAYVSASPQAGWPVVVPSAEYVYQYYAGGDPRGWFTAGRLDDRMAVANEFERRLAGVQECWFVLYRLWVIDPGDHLPSVMASEGTVVESLSFDGVRLLRWQRTGVGDGDGGES